MGVKSPQEARTMRALIVRSGPQMSGVNITKEAIEGIYKNEEIIGMPIFDQVNYEKGFPVGYLDHLDILIGTDGEYELYGWFVYVADKPFGEESFCSYSISYEKEDFDEETKTLPKCQLNACVMMKMENAAKEFAPAEEPKNESENV